MRITRVFLDIPMGYGFPKLRETAQEAKVKLGPDSTVLFINRSHTAFKMLVNDNYVVHYRNEKRQPIPIDALKFLPAQFEGTEVEMQAAIKRSIMEKLDIKDW